MISYINIWVVLRRKFGYIDNLINFRSYRLTNVNIVKLTYDDVLDQVVSSCLLVFYARYRYMLLL